MVESKTPSLSENVNTSENSEDAASFLFDMGFVPIQVVGKNPAFGEGEGWQTRTYTDRNEVRKHFERWDGVKKVKDGDKLVDQHKNIGVLTDGFLMLGPNTPEALTALRAGFPMYDETLQRMGNNPYPCAILRIHGEPFPFKGQKILTDEKSPKTMADIWGNGSQFVAWGVHPAGARYRFVNDKSILPITSAAAISMLRSTMEAIGPGFKLKTPIEKARIAAPTMQTETDIFKAVKRAVRASDLLGTTEKRVKCPFHKQGSSNPSCVVYEDPLGDSLYCHSAGCFGDVITLNATLKGYSKMIDSALNLASRFAPHIIPLTLHNNGTNGLVPSHLDSMGQISVSHLSRRRPPHGTAWDSMGQMASYIEDARLVSHVPSDLGKEGVEFVSLARFKPTKPGRVFLPPFLSAGTINLVAAPRASFKSTLTCFLASRVSVGADFLGFLAPDPLRVSVWDCENGEFHVHSMLRGCIASLSTEEQRTLAGENISLTASANPALLMKALVDWTPETAPNILILDGFRRFLLDGDENDSAAISTFLMDIKAECERLGTAVIFIHHARKTQQGGGSDFDDKMDSIRGSGDIAAMCSSIILLKRVGESDKAHLQFAKCRWCREPPARSIQIYHADDLIDITTSGYSTREDFENCQRADIILGWAKKKGIFKASRLEIANGTGVNYKSVARSLAWMMDQGSAERVTKGSYEFPTLKPKLTRQISLSPEERKATPPEEP